LGADAVARVGADAVARAEADGHTLLMSSAGVLTINEFLYEKMAFDPRTAFAPVSIVADMPMLLVVRADLPARDAAEFIKLAKEKPLFYGSPGHGTTGHLGMELFMHATGLKLQHVPYKSAAEAVQAALAGQTQAMFDNPPTVMAHIRAGGLRALAWRRRSALRRYPMCGRYPKRARVQDCRDSRRAPGSGWWRPRKRRRRSSSAWPRIQRLHSRIRRCRSASAISARASWAIRRRTLPSASAKSGRGGER
jgi:hypothetical protein